MCQDTNNWLTLFSSRTWTILFDRSMAAFHQRTFISRRSNMTCIVATWTRGHSVTCFFRTFHCDIIIIIVYLKRPLIFDTLKNNQGWVHRHCLPLLILWIGQWLLQVSLYQGHVCCAIWSMTVFAADHWTELVCYFYIDPLMATNRIVSMMALLQWLYQRRFAQCTFSIDSWIYWTRKIDLPIFSIHVTI